jgi:hypothetical protein
MVSILVIGALGYIDSLKAFSRIFMALIVVALFLKGNQGTSFFSNFQSALTSLGSGNFSGALSSLAGSTSSGSVSNAPVSLGGLPGTYTGPDYSGLAALGIETPLASGRNN